MKEKEVSLKELKKEANNVRALSQVKEAVVNFFNLNAGRRPQINLVIVFVQRGFCGLR